MKWTEGIRTKGNVTQGNSFRKPAALCAQGTHDSTRDILLAETHYPQETMKK